MRKTKGEINMSSSTILNAIAELQKHVPQLQELMLPVDQSENQEKLAEQQLMEEYAKQHAPLTIAFHAEWKGYVLMDFYSLPTEKAVSKWYTSRYQCELAAKEAIRQAYELANRYVTISENKNVSHIVAAEYADLLKSVFSKYQTALQSCCTLLNKEDTYRQIEKKIATSEEYLKRKYEEELLQSWEYYEMYRLDYFYDKIEVEEHDNRISEGTILRAFEAMFTDNIEYTYAGVWDAISELEKDLNENLTTFYRRAHVEYIEYIAEIETLLDSLDDEFCKLVSSAKQESPIMAAISNMMKQENG